MVVLVGVAATAAGEEQAGEEDGRQDEGGDGAVAGSGVDHGVSRGSVAMTGLWTDVAWSARAFFVKVLATWCVA